MKNRKSLAAIIVAFVLVAVFAAPVFAAEYQLKLPPLGADDGIPVPLGAWFTNGTDDKDFDLSWDVLGKSTALVLEMPQPETIMLILGGSGSLGWWTEYKEMEQYWADGKLTINWKTIGVDIAKLADVNDEGFYPAKIFVGDWGTDFADYGVTKAYLVYSEPGSGNTSSGGDKENPKTGDNTIFAITGILALAAGATVFVARKVKAQ